MLNHIGIDTLVKELDLLHVERGYVQSVANVAYAMMNHVDSLLTDMLNGNPERIAEFFTAVEQAERDPEAITLSEDLNIYEQISHEIIPTIAETYNVSVEDVLDDFDTIANFYMIKQLEADLANHI